MHIVEFTAGSLRFVDTVPAQPPADGFVWVYLERAEYAATLPEQQALAQRLGGSALLDVHARDLANEAHPSHFDATSVYDRVIFRRLATAEEARATAAAGDAPDAAARIDSRAVGFAVFDGLLVSVHPAGCPVAVGFIERLATDARLSVDAASARSRLPQSPVDLALRLINVMVDSYLELRKALTRRLEAAQHLLLRQRPAAQAWPALMQARQQLGWLQELCEEQQDAMQEWLDALREQPLADWGADTALALHRRDGLVARARDVMEHIDRVLHHARRLEQSAETAVQIHFNAQGQRTNDIMRTLTAITAVFLPLNLFTGFFGMNFDHLPLIHSGPGMWVALALLLALALAIVVLFWRRHYLSHERDDEGSS
ncbi:MAG: magnesium transporter CorA family protein [Burkholderiaceae bacterium]|nr:magnesium transporter CorA family protein [Pseudomonadota bacterium]MBS0596465.1 magnesium transporter CorA family protein [Pseudomonadota bacterium]MCO5117022.1 magnesium transporter CorA family protein [Burkholderiaceae bacterium]MCP5216732.1 magnesium transporter CorA family protein [Burkholderiaceae bacterium]